MIFVDSFDIDGARLWPPNTCRFVDNFVDVPALNIRLQNGIIWKKIVRV
jgi:hypothetical protein